VISCKLYPLVLLTLSFAPCCNQIIAVGPTWEDSQFNENCSDYVDETCDRYALICRALLLPTSALPLGILRTTWEHIVEGGYLSLLEGFSRIPYCSTEGRSLMSMDLASFSSGIDRLNTEESTRPPPQVSPKRGMRYVDMYIRVFYYPEEVSHNFTAAINWSVDSYTADAHSLDQDMMKWIVSNYREYQLNHSLALLTSGASENTNVQKLTKSVQLLYTESASIGQGPWTNRSNLRQLLG
jgi:succinate dehydrogenase flavin-adding protein (antitoxin of CptAB toxin-antitoxin module)